MIRYTFYISQNYGHFEIHPYYFPSANFTHVIFTLAYHNRIAPCGELGDTRIARILFIGTMPLRSLQCLSSGQLVCLLGTGR